MSDGNSHFMMALGRHDGGHLLDKADEELRKVISAVIQNGKRGSVTLKISVAPNGETGLQVEPSLSTAMPASTFGKAFYFQDRQGDLSRNAPDYVAQSLLKIDEKEKS